MTAKGTLNDALHHTTENTLPCQLNEQEGFRPDSPVHEHTSKDDDHQQNQSLGTTSSSSKSRIRISISRKLARYRRNFGMLLLHGVCLMVYVLPMMILPHPFHEGRPVLDEMHILSSEHRDVNNDGTELDNDLTRVLTNIWNNDYWGRPMNATNSHKSWRPLTILSFRYLKGGRLLKDLTAHRLVNIVTHAAVAELVSLLAVQLIYPQTTLAIGERSAPPPSDSTTIFYLRVFAKLLFALHPTHVEVTSNAANRPHLLAVLASVLLCDVTLRPWLFLLALCGGFLSCETFLFQVPAVMVTLAAISYNRLYHGPQQVRHRGSKLGQVMAVLRLPGVAWRLGVLLTSGIAYYAYRHTRDWLSIPDGLIRPAENPFYEFVGEERLRNYLFVVAVHILKAWDFDIIGFSHEYGRECIKPIQSWNDPLLLVPLAIMAIYFLSLLYLGMRQRRRSVWSMSLILFLVHLAWMATLFPISGIVKVGTFIADRIVVASSVSVSILVAHWLSSWVTVRLKQSSLWKLVLLAFVGMLQWRRVHRRTIDWMDSKLLLESSLKTCPRFAKAHLESSKIYSGLYPQLFNLTKSRWHLEQVEEIDPDFCDVHQQFAYIAIQENNHEEFEKRLVKSLLCPFTLGSGLPMWQSYWEQNLRQGSEASKAAAYARYEEYMKEIQQAVRDAEQNDGAGHSNSPLVGWNRKEP